MTDRAGMVPAPIVIPDAPAHEAGIAGLNPLMANWPAHQVMSRVYDVKWGPRDFYVGRPGGARFSPFTPVGATTPLDVLYAAGDDFGALSETVFHDVPVTGSAKRILAESLTHRVLIDIEPARDLRLVDLTSHGLARLGLSRIQLIESDPRSYRDTAAWGRALHAHQSEPDGLLWVSRQHDRSQCVVLFSDRVAKSDLAVARRPPRPLAFAAGWDLVCDFADRAGITVIGGPALP